MTSAYEALQEVISLLERTTPEALRFAYGPRIPAGPELISGIHLLKLWEWWMAQDKQKQAYGLYFLFFRAGKVTVPVYVGKGWIPDRPIDHLAPSQFFDQLMSSYFGGIHRHPHALPSKRRKSVMKKLPPLLLGAVVFSAERRKAEELGCGDYEKKFIRVLQPLANRKEGTRGSYYCDDFTSDFSEEDKWKLDRIAKAWLQEPLESAAAQLKSLSRSVRRIHNKAILQPPLTN